MYQFHLLSMPAAAPATLLKRERQREELESHGKTLQSSGGRQTWALSRKGNLPKLAWAHRSALGDSTQSIRLEDFSLF